MPQACEPPELQALKKAALGAAFRPRDAEERAGIPAQVLPALVAEGWLEHIERGLYRLSDAEVSENYSLAIACARVPRSVVCLLSALRVHGIGTQAPAAVWLAIPNHARPPRLVSVKTRIVRFSGSAWYYGVEEKSFEGVPARITSPARTIVDCFRYERLVGREVALEALHDALRLGVVSMDALDRVLEELPSQKCRAVLEAIAL